MLKDLVPQFADAAKKFPDLVMDNYELKDGLYIRLSLNRPFTAIDEQDYLVIDKKKEVPVSKASLFRWFKSRDLFSSVLNIDKAVDQGKGRKKIHSINHLSLFVKKENLLGTEKERAVVDKKYLCDFLQVILPKSPKKLLDLYPITAKKKSGRQQQENEREHFFQQHYSELLDYLQSQERKERQRDVLQFWDKYFAAFIEKAKELAGEKKVSNYIKVFFEADEAEYEKEYKLYVLPRIFNVNDFNQLVDGEIVGLPAYDVSMNSKKPFFELKTMKTKVPTRISVEEALYVKYLYQWLNKQGKFIELMLPFHELFGPGTGDQKGKDVANGAFYLSLDKNGSVEYFDNIPFQPRTNWSLQIENVLEVQEKHGDLWMMNPYPDIQGKGQLRQEISRLFFGNCLPKNLLDAEPPKAKETVFTAEMVSVYVMVRQALFDFLVKDTEETIRPFLQKYSLQLIEIQLLKTIEGLAFRKMADAFQLRLALLTKANEKEGIKLSDKLKELYGGLKEKLSKRNELIVCESDEEFFFLAGQVGYYLLGQSEASNKTYGLAEPVLKARNPEVLKNRLTDLFDTYKHAIKYEHVAFKSALAMIQGYETNAKIEGSNKSMLLAGLLANNLFYQKNEKKDTGEVKNG